MSEVLETRVNYNEMTEIESLCPSCEKNGSTRLLFCKIPFFGDVIVSSFSCPNCNFKNSEIDSAQKIQDYGIRYKLKVTKIEDLHRMVVTSPYCKVIIPDLDFEVPNVKKGTVSSVEGLFDIFIKDLEEQQPVRKIMDPDNYAKIDAFVGRLKDFVSLKAEVLPYYFILEDPSGNSFIENPTAPLKDVNLSEQKFVQTKEHLIKMGYVANDEQTKEGQMVKEEPKKSEKSKKVMHYGDKEINDMIQKMHNVERLNMAHKVDKSLPIQQENMDLDERLCLFQLNCFSCDKEGEMRSFKFEIPFFKEVIVMCFKCMHCGYKDTEVKTGGEISPNAKKITLSCTDPDDLNRDIFKSETAIVTIKELELEMMPGSLGSFYTTIEGLIGLMEDRLTKSNPFRGDSQQAETLGVNYYILN